MSDVDRPRRVDADELYLDASTLPIIHATVCVPSLPDHVDLLREPCGIEPEVHKPRTDGLHACEDAAGGRRGRDGLGDVEGVTSHDTGQLHRRGRGEVPVLRVLRTLDRHRVDLNVRQAAVRLRRTQRVGQEVADQVGKSHAFGARQEESTRWRSGRLRGSHRVADYDRLVTMWAGRDDVNRHSDQLLQAVEIRSRIPR